MPKKALQDYPRLPDSDLLDDSKLLQHSYRLPFSKLRKIIHHAIETADKKSSRFILNLPEDASEELVEWTCQNEGRELFNYFRQYFGDPASTAHQCLNRHYSEVAKEQFRNRTLQKERMNTAWRYQYIAKDTANQSKRFESLSDIGLREADFNATIRYKHSESRLAMYVSVKNRSNTLGGQDWPKAIEALETEARYDKNRAGHYICVFGFTIGRGQRGIRKNKKGIPYSINTELWYADFFWPFFSNYAYEEIVKAVLKVLLEIKVENKTEAREIPQGLLDSFGTCCREYALLNEKGYFYDAFKLVELFCRKTSTVKTAKVGSNRTTKKKIRSKTARVRIR